MYLHVKCNKDTLKYSVTQTCLVVMMIIDLGYTLF